MGKSARILGRLLNLSDREINVLLKFNGFLEGEPGDYHVTEEGEPYATERYEHRGPGGSACYNRDWTERTWDDSILDVMDTSPEMIKKAKEYLSERRRARYTADAEEVEEEPLVGEDEEPDDYDSSGYTDPATVVKGMAIVCTIVGAIIAAPHVKKFYTEKVKPTCKRAWCKVTKKPYEPIEEAETLEKPPAEDINQGDHEVKKDGE